MNAQKSRIHVLHQPKDLSKHASTGVSLHCHTLYSREMLDFVPYYAERIPVVSYFWRRECRRYIESEGSMPDLSKGYWSPPLTGEEVFESERAQMNDAGLDAFISITDHDAIDANLELNRTFSNEAAPISMEWTVPFRCAFFHIGVHNLPPARAEVIRDILLGYTFNKNVQNDEKLHEIFGMLDEIPEVLIVLNHPIWDIEMIGQEIHMDQLKQFVAEHGKWIHAFEVNGFRSWSENKQTIEMAEAHGFPLISGGDRHCCNHNTMINITGATTFAEFVREVRVDKYSEVVIMPGYHTSLAYRQVRSTAQILKNYSDFPDGRKLWTDRVFLDFEDDAGMRPLSYHWKDAEPYWVRLLMGTLRVVSNENLRPLFRLITPREDIIPRHKKVTQKARLPRRRGHLAEV